METPILHLLNSIKNFPCEEKKMEQKRQGFKCRRKRVWKRTERSGWRGSEIEGKKERKKERKKEKRRKERKQFNPEKYNPVCKPIDAKLGLAYVCHGSSREYFWGKLHAEYYK